VTATEADVTYMNKLGVTYANYYTNEWARI
jgi:hypothetical protein